MGKEDTKAPKDKKIKEKDLKAKATDIAEEKEIKTKEDKEIKENKESEEKSTAKSDGSIDKPKVKSSKKWMIGCIIASIAAVGLLISTIVLAVQPARVEYVYNEPETTDDYSSSSDDFWSLYEYLYGSSSEEKDSSSSSSGSSSSKSNTTTYTAGEKVGTSIAGVTIEVEQVIRNYQNYPRNWEPDDGYEYVQLKLKLTNNSTNAVYLSYSDFYLKDSEGMMGDAETSHHDSSTNYFPFTKEVSGGGSSVSGVMVFEVRKGYTDNLTFLYEKDNTKKSISIKL